MPWWAWTIIAATLLAGLDLVVQWTWLRLRPPPHYDRMRPCPACGAEVPHATWRCYSCRRWIRRRGTVAALSVLQVPAFVGGLVLLLVMLVLSALLWFGWRLLGPLLQTRPIRIPARWFFRLWGMLLGPVRRLWGRRERRAYWWRGGRERHRYRIPAEGGSPGGQVAFLFEIVVGGREVPGAWRGAVVWLREPDAVIRSSFVAATHLTEAASIEGWVDRGTFHRVMLEPVREWVGWKGTRQDLEALGDLYLAVPGGIGLVAIGTGCDRPPDEWSGEPGEHPPAWISLETFRDGSGWSAMLHWDLSYPPDPVPEEYRYPPS